MTKSQSKHELEFVWAMDDGEIDKIRSLHQTYEELRQNRDSGGLPWLVPAVKAPNLEVLKFVLTLGYDINTVGVPPFGGTSALQIAIGRNCLERTAILLNAGASPNVDRPILACMTTRFPPERQVEFLQLLLKFDADLNRLYDIYGNTTKLFSALDFAPPDEIVRCFLLERGALSSQAIRPTL